eukprot:gb/GEZN01006955.1/.p1 GENE.gb/GEZN01006955.1/~~gb/GEZN01006955.1/.p1  ORF type:complete len:389 (-),score=85.55 gb/GEZN01006955.1/:385-1551(-)
MLLSTQDRKTWSGHNLIIACELSQLKEVRRLLHEEEAPFDFEDATGNTPLLSAVHSGDEEVLSCLLEARSQVNYSCKAHGYTALHVAAKLGFTEAARSLLLCKADLAIVNSYGRTALAEAEHWQHPQTALFLLTQRFPALLPNLLEETREQKVSHAKDDTESPESLFVSVPALASFSPTVTTRPGLAIASQLQEPPSSPPPYPPPSPPSLPSSCTRSIHLACTVAADSPLSPPPPPADLPSRLASVHLSLTNPEYALPLFPLLPPALELSQKGTLASKTPKPRDPVKKGKKKKKDKVSNVTKKKTKGKKRRVKKSSKENDDQGEEEEAKEETEDWRSAYSSYCATELGQSNREEAGYVEDDDEEYDSQVIEGDWATPYYAFMKRTGRG